MEGGCIFGLTDSDVGTLVATLQPSVNLWLGEVCNSVTYCTAVSPLLLSTHYLELTSLETHFNTPHIVRDIECLLNEDFERGKSRCKLQSLSVGRLSLRVPGTLAMGFADSFSRLEVFSISVGWGAWERVESKLRDQSTYSL